MYFESSDSDAQAVAQVAQVAQPKSVNPDDIPELRYLLGSVAQDAGAMYDPRIVRGGYILEEQDLAEDLKVLLHGRAYVVDRESITDTDSNAPRTYYIAADKVSGLIVPARSLSIDNHGPGDAYYRWTDDGEKFTSWVSMYDGVTHDYSVDEKCRFAEIQVYVSESGARVSLRATR